MSQGQSSKSDNRVVDATLTEHEDSMNSPTDLSEVPDSIPVTAGGRAASDYLQSVIT